jgi:hypothetical protein
VPVEGQHQRVNTPLRRLPPRERNIALAGLGVTIVAILVLVLATAGDSEPGPAPGCFSVNVAGRVGGEQVHACGGEARAACARAATFEDERANEIVAECEKRGIGF